MGVRKINRSKWGNGEGHIYSSGGVKGPIRRTRTIVDVPKKEIGVILLHKERACWSY